MTKMTTRKRKPKPKPKAKPQAKPKAKRGRKKKVLRIRRPVPLLPGVVELIDKADPERIVAASAHCGDKKITLAAVHKWRSRGIPSTHWGVIMELTGVPLDEIYAINADCKRPKRAA